MTWTIRLSTGECRDVAGLLTIPHVDAAPAPAAGRAAKEKLEVLKKRLPDIVSSWAKKHWYGSEAVEVTWSS
jgi:hypothetical protein